MQTRHVLLLVVATAAAYAPAFSAQHVLDDAIAFEQHISVHRGCAGLGEIFTQDSFAGFFETFAMAPQIAGGRYRPLAIASFAVEQCLFGETLGDEFRATSDPVARAELLETRMRDASVRLAPLRHGVNVALYIAAVLMLYQWLVRSRLFGATAALVASLLFALHPVHTEAVANIKSRDELLSLLFILCAFWFAARNKRWLCVGAAFLGMLSKEYAVMLFALVPIVLTVSEGASFWVMVKRWSPPLLLVTACYAAMRFAAAGVGPESPLALRDILNDPFLPLRLGEVPGSVLATKIAILPTYLRLLVWPHPLASDYSYATFPFVGFADLRVVGSVCVYGALIAWGGWLLARRHVLGVCIALFLGFLFPVSNLVLETTSTLGERLVLHASLGFCMAAALLVVRLRLPGLAVVLCYASLTFLRASQWHDNTTLFLADVKVVPNSALVNANAGGYLLEDALKRVRERRLAGTPLTPDERAQIRAITERATPYLERALVLHPRFANAAINVGLAHWVNDDFDGAASAFVKAAQIFPSHPVLARYAANFHVMGNDAARTGDLDRAIHFFEQATAIVPSEPRFWRDLAGASFVRLRFSSARDAFDRVLVLRPNDQDAGRGRDAAQGLRVLELAALAPDAPRAAVLRFAEALESNAAPQLRERARELRALQ